jgi:hypothetical protein
METLLSGMLCRLQGDEKDGKLRALQNCVLFLQAQKLGLVVLTANVGDYDILLQLNPTGRVPCGGTALKSISDIDVGCYVAS